MKTTAGGALLLAVTLALGCVTSQERDVLVPKQDQLLTDVLYPSSFEFAAEQSSDFSDSQAKKRFAVHLYVGSAKFLKVVDFYKKEMPVESWKLRQEIGSGGLKTLYFEKAPARGKTALQQCIVTISSQGGQAQTIQVIRLEE
jgi:hypothetical protein